MAAGNSSSMASTLLGNSTTAAPPANLSNPHESLSILADEISQTKIIASLVLFAITLLCGYLPVRMILNQKYIQHLLFAGGGVLMATAFCHLIPETHDSYKHYLNVTLGRSHSHEHAPEVAAAPQHPAYQHHHDNNETTTPAGGADQEDGLVAHLNALNVPYLEMTLCFGFFFMYLVEQLMLKFINSHTHEHPCDTSTGQLIIGTESPYQQQQRQQQQQQPNQQPNQQQAHEHGHEHSNGNKRSSSVANLSSSYSSASANGSKATELYKFLRGLLIVSAFVLHSIFDGVAIGSQDTVAKVWTIFAAISCHKLIIAAVVGLELFAATLESHLWTLVHLGIFSAMSPAGILLVLLAQNSLNLSSDHPAMILLQSFATGTLLYIIFIEILQPKGEHLRAKDRIWKSFSLILGFALMLAVLTFIGHGD